MVFGLMGMGAEAPASMPAHWKTYFAVDDCDAAVARVKARGGAVFLEPMDSPYGRMAIVADPFGAMFAVLQPPPKK
jgi:predicted enzyme related to lactoylglutathione lyase